MLMYQTLYLLSLAFSPALWMQILLEEAELKPHNPKRFLQSHQKWRWEKIFRLLLDKHRVYFCLFWMLELEPGAFGNVVCSIMEPHPNHKSFLFQVCVCV